METSLVSLSMLGSSHSTIQGSMSHSTAHQSIHGSTINQFSMNASTMQMDLKRAHSDSVGSARHLAVLGEKIYHKMDKSVLLKSLEQMERAIVSNVYERMQFTYRGVDILDILKPKEEDQQNQEKENVPHKKKSEKTSSMPSLRFLWGFRCDLSKHRTAMSMTWNKQNKVSLFRGLGVRLSV